MQRKLVGSLFSSVCKHCVDNKAAAREAERLRHEAQLKAIKWETLAEAHKLEIERLTRILESRQPTPVGGGFSQPLEPEVEEAKAAKDAPDFAQRVDEIFGNGIDLNEFIKRQERYRRDRIADLEAEKAEIRKELQKIP